EDVAVDVKQRGTVVATADLVHLPQFVVEGLAGHGPVSGAAHGPDCRLPLDDSNGYFSSIRFHQGMHMDLPGLAAFVAVAEHGGFSLAAERLHLTQPAVSKRIAQLEATLETRLFDRLGRQVVLTEAG